MTTLPTFVYYWKTPVGILSILVYETILFLFGNTGTVGCYNALSRLLSQT